MAQVAAPALRPLVVFSQAEWGHDAGAGGERTALGTGVEMAGFSVENLHDLHGKIYGFRLRFSQENQSIDIRYRYKHMYNMIWYIYIYDIYIYMCVIYIYMCVIYCDILPSPACIAKPMRIEVYMIYIYLPSSKLTVRPWKWPCFNGN